MGFHGQDDQRRFGHGGVGIAGDPDAVVLGERGAAVSDDFRHHQIGRLEPAARDQAANDGSAHGAAADNCCVHSLALFVAAGLGRIVPRATSQAGRRTSMSLESARIDMTVPATTFASGRLSLWVNGNGCDLGAGGMGDQQQADACPRARASESDGSKGAASGEHQYVGGRAGRRPGCTRWRDEGCDIPR